MDAKGNIIKTTNTDELGWFLFNELPASGDYIVALDEEDPHFISKKSFAEFKDEKGNVLKTKNVGNKYQLVDNKKTSVSFKNNQKAIAAQKEQLKSYTANAIATQISTGIKGQKLTKEETSQIINDLLEERDFQYGKNKERKKIVDYMLEYNLYAKDGDKNRAILAYMVLNPAFDKKIEKMFSSKEIDKFIEDHKTNVNKKFNLKEKTKNEISKFKFKQ